MKMKTMLSIITSALLLSGCGGGGGGDAVEEVQSTGIPEGIYKSILCTDKNANDQVCADLSAFDLSKESVAILEAPETIGASLFEYFDGKRFVLVPKEEGEVSPLHMLAYGLYLYAQERGEDWCGPCRMAAPASYAEALEMLEKEFGLTGTEAQNEAILEAFNANLERLGEQRMDLKSAVYADIKAMAESLVNMTVNGAFPDLSGLHPVRKDGIVIGTTLMDAAQTMLPPNDDRHTPYFLGIDKQHAIDLAGRSPSHSETAHNINTVFEKFSCEDTQTKQIFMYGVYDGFDTTNTEQTHPSAALSAALTVPPSMNHGYDYPANEYNPSVFMETLDALPVDISSGMIAIGLQEKRSEKQGYTDIYLIGDGIGGNNFSGTGGQIHDLRADWDSPADDVYTHMLSTLPSPAGQPDVLTTIQSQGALDMLLLTKTNVDFVAIAACVPQEKPDPDPLPPVKLECNEEIGEHMVAITGGAADNFAAGFDTATPSTALSSVFGTTIQYDEPIKKLGYFGDTLAHPGGQITQLELLVNARTSPSAINATQHIFAGSSTAMQFALKQGTYGNSGTAHIFSGSDTVYDANGVAQGDLLSLFNSSTQGIDIVTGLQTEVDYTRLAACIIEAPQEGDIGIEKKLIKSYTRGGLHYGIFQITFSGTLPAGESLMFEDTVPSGADITHINAAPWNCNPTPIISGGQTLSCSLTGLASPIPSIEVTMRTKEGEIENCAQIHTKEDRPYYNTDPENDRSCDTFTPPTGTPNPQPGSCSEVVKLDLRPASSWVDPSGTHPTENNVFSTYPPHPAWANVIWDGAMNWFDYGNAGNTVHPLSIDFCACGPTQITIDALKSDNFSKIYLDTDPTPGSYTNSAYIASRSNGISQSTMASWGPNVSGSLSVPAPGSATDHTLHFDVKNGFGPSGGAVNGTLDFIGHLGACTPNDVPDTNGSDDNDTGGVGEPWVDLNWTVTYYESNVSVTDIFYDPEGGTEGNGTVVIDLAGPIATLTDADKPIIDKDPHIVVDVAHLGDIEMSPGMAVYLDHLIHPPHYTRDDNKSVVIDHQQELMWQDDEEAATIRKPIISQASYAAGDYSNRSGDTASSYCAALTLGGYNDWRMPTIDELSSIVDYNHTQPNIDTDFFMHTAGDGEAFYWSSTFGDDPNGYYGSNPLGSWGISFGDGHPNHGNGSRYIPSHIRCVRDLP